MQSGHSGDTVPPVATSVSGRAGGRAARRQRRHRAAVGRRGPAEDHQDRGRAPPDRRQGPGPVPHRDRSKPGRARSSVQSARNRFVGVVTRVERDTLTAIVEMQAGPHRVVSLITREARRRARRRGGRPRGRRGEGDQRDHRGAAGGSDDERGRIVRNSPCVDDRVVLVGVRRGAVAARHVGSARDAAGRRRSRHGAITVSAAASLTEAFTKIGDGLQAANPGATVTFNFGSSGTLETQIQQRRAGRLVRVGRRGQHEQARHARAWSTGPPTVFATEQARDRDQAREPEGHQDAGRPRQRPSVVSLCGVTVPCGKYAGADPADRRGDHPRDEGHRGART